MTGNGSERELREAAEEAIELFARTERYVRGEEFAKDIRAYIEFLQAKARRAFEAGIRELSAATIEQREPRRFDEWEQCEHETKASNQYEG